MNSLGWAERHGNRAGVGPGTNWCADSLAWREGPGQVRLDLHKLCGPGTNGNEAGCAWVGAKGQGQAQGHQKFGQSPAPGPLSPADGGEGPGVSRNRPKGPPMQDPTVCADSLDLGSYNNIIQ